MERAHGRTTQGRARGAGRLAAIGVAVLALAILVGQSVEGIGAPVTGALLPSRAPQEEAPAATGGPEQRGAVGGLGSEFTGEAVLVHNPLYSTGRLAPLPCPAPALDVDDPESMRRFLDTVTDCLDQAWATQFARAGLDFQPPERVFWEEAGSSPCRDYPSAAGGFYCRASESVYIGVRDVVDKWHSSTDSVVYASLLAHEYGHHVQGEAGILDYYHERRRTESDPAEQSAWTRRSELQANCLAGVFLGSVSVTYPIGDAERRTLLDDAAVTADREGSTDAERTHGSARNSVLWLERGLDRQTPGACNTWAAESDLLQ
ncbi:neutral zinc metallopeptidase [Thermobifida halotolerans]|uniref:Neutral zinc metallopeptidase n=1 Tax=Thermobifida halotolerans TaxID=483545 RepID=A0A399FVB2_9ACTN|nr:neutral zinc metallopeptidase [Thermobifida halotolerans]UOE18749.1 neutral zinc metallopeptidase [Thermobifida halotolerans]